MNPRDQLKERLFEYLNRNLSDNCKRSISPSQINEILDCVVDWAYGRAGLGNVKFLSDRTEFLEELEKL